MVSENNISTLADLFQCVHFFLLNMHILRNSRYANVLFLISNMLIRPGICLQSSSTTQNKKSHQPKKCSNIYFLVSQVPTIEIVHFNFEVMIWFQVPLRIT